MLAAHHGPRSTGPHKGLANLEDGGWEYVGAQIQNRSLHTVIFLLLSSVHVCFPAEKHVYITTKPEGFIYKPGLRSSSQSCANLAPGTPSLFMSYEAKQKQRSRVPRGMCGRESIAKTEQSTEGNGVGRRQSAWAYEPSSPVGLYMMVVRNYTNGLARQFTS